MNNNDFLVYAEKMVSHCKTTLAVKNVRYGGETDRFLQFKQMGQMFNRLPEEMLMTLLLKHITALVKHTSKESVVFKQLPDSMGNYVEIIGDSINYLLLLYGLLVERNINSEKENLKGVKK